jgi:hypothetical protein
MGLRHDGQHDLRSDRMTRGPAEPRHENPATQTPASAGVLLCRAIAPTFGGITLERTIFGGRDGRGVLSFAVIEDDPLSAYCGTMSTRIYLSRSEVAERIGVAPDTLGRYKLPEPDALIGSTRGWLPATIDAWNASRPGRGVGGGRPRKATRRRASSH